MKKNILSITIVCSLFFATASHASSEINENTPSKAQYFSWINNTNEGATEAHTMTNLAFFAWLKQEYGMQLDIYAFDAGAIDGKRWYGSTNSDKFKQQFPNGFDPIYKQAKSLGIRLGIWGGPDGFGDTPESEQARIEQMVSLCRDYEFELFKFDSVAGQLRTEKQQAFAQMMQLCRQYSPDLILLNHRLNLGEVGTPHATTFLWEGQETYIDVHLANDKPAPHHRAGALSRGLPPKLSRLTEDHGVCLSNALDYWDDELILQAFNRALILSPQIYCNPWLLRDDEFPKLARIFNLARQYNDILVSGIVLPSKRYGPDAVSRGDDQTRLITLRNLTWKNKTITLKLDEEIGLANHQPDDKYEVRQYHPGEKIIGDFDYNDKVTISIAPFRSALIRVTSDPGWRYEGHTYDVIKEVPNESLQLAVYEQPDQVNKLTKLGKLVPISLPQDAQALYETTVFSADNNALEVRALERSGPSDIPQVQAARDAFFNQKAFIDRGIWDKNLFDGNTNTAFYKMQRWQYNWNIDPDSTVAGGALRLDLGSSQKVDQIILRSRDDASIQPLKIGEGIIAEVSNDLINWSPIRFVAEPTMTLKMPVPGFTMRYLRLAEAPKWLSEIEAYYQGVALDRKTWRASNLFGHYNELKFQRAWRQKFTLDHIDRGAYLVVAAEGEYGNEAVYAGVKVDGKYVGASGRAPAYPANTWELQVKPVNGNYAYYIPLNTDWVGKKIEVVLLGKQQAKKIKPEVWYAVRPNMQGKKIVDLVLD